MGNFSSLLDLACREDNNRPSSAQHHVVSPFSQNHTKHGPPNSLNLKEEQESGQNEAPHDDLVYEYLLERTWRKQTSSFQRKRDKRKGFKAFLKEYPQYKLTAAIDVFRDKDYSRLKLGEETYVDWTGGALYPESLVRRHASFLTSNMFGNTHSASTSSSLSSRCSSEARSSVLSFFDADPETYTVVFTSNATAALKLVGESFPFSHDSAYVLAADSHNSVHGIREFAKAKDAKVIYIPSTNKGGFELHDAKAVLQDAFKSTSSQELSPSLFALTGQSNITNSKISLSVAHYAMELGYYTLLDAAALASTSSISLRYINIDAMAVSFYKMFGYPTGVGALIVKKSFARDVLVRPWFAGGTVSVVQAPGLLMTRSEHIEECFEDGTVNYLDLDAITSGLQTLSSYLPLLPLRLSCLVDYLVSCLSKIHYRETGSSVVKILSRHSGPLQNIGEQSDSGSLVAMLLFDRNGTMLPLSFVSRLAQLASISLRTGCMCNPGGAAALLSIQPHMQNFRAGVSLNDFERQVGHELGVVRVSLGLASNWTDVSHVVQFVKAIANLGLDCHQPSNLGL